MIKVITLGDRMLVYLHGYSRILVSFPDTAVTGLSNYRLVVLNNIDIFEDEKQLDVSNVIKHET